MIFSLFFVSGPSVLGECIFQNLFYYYRKDLIKRPDAYLIFRL